MTWPPRFHLLALPPELLIQEIFSCIPTPSIIACSRTCKTLHILITSSVLLTYLRELFVAGMTDNPRCTYTTFPITKRLEMLLDRERRWLHLDPRWRRTLELSPPQDRQQSYDVAPGHLIFGLARPNIGDVVRSLRLPSELAEEIVWNESAGVGQDILNVGMALKEHNLIACLACTDLEAPSNLQAHLLNYSTGEHHPSAVSPIITIPSPFSQPDVVWGDIAVCGENLAVSVKYSKERVVADESSTDIMVNRMQIWDWKRGVDKGALEIEKFNETEGLGFNGLTFLREDILLTPNSEENSLDAYHIPHLPLYGGPVEIVQLIARFWLPDLEGDIEDYSIDCCLSPSHCSSTPGMPEHISTEKPFMNDPGRSILALTINLVNGEGRRTLFLLIRWKYLLHCGLAALEEFAGSTPRHKVHPWDEWGPHNCRLFPVPNLRPSAVTTTGSRWVSLTKAPEQDEDSSNDLPYKIELYDFDETRIKLFSHRASTRDSARLLEFMEKPKPGLRVELVDTTSPSIYPTSEGVFAEDIRTHLPYIRTTYASGSPGTTSFDRMDEDSLHPPARPDLCNWGGILVDDQRIIGIHCDNDHEDFQEIEILYLG